MDKNQILNEICLEFFDFYQIAEKIRISRQAYGKWEKGETIPDIEKCGLLASVYGITIDRLIMLGGEAEGIALVKEEAFTDRIDMAMQLASNTSKV